MDRRIRTRDESAQTGFSTSKNDYHGLNERCLGGDAHEVPKKGHYGDGARHVPELRIIGA